MSIASVSEKYQTNSVFEAVTQLRRHFGYMQFDAEHAGFDYSERSYQFGSFQLLDIKAKGAVHVKHYKHNNKFSFDFPIEGHFLIESKAEPIKVDKEGVFITSSSATPHFSIPLGISGLSLHIIEDELINELTKLIGFRPDERLKFPLYISDPTATQCIKEALFGIMLTLKTIKNEAVRQSYSKSADSYLKTLLLTTFSNNAHKYFAVAELQQLPRHLTHAISYMNKNISEKINIIDLQAATNVSARVLNYQFKKHTQKTPMAYLLHLRLLRLQEELKAADPKAKIIDIAISLGFSHLGRLSVKYKSYFGESPSETLKKQLA